MKILAIRKYLIISLAIALVACGGGSGGSTGGGPPGGNDGGSGSRLAITQESAEIVTRSTIDSSAVVLKLTHQLLFGLIKLGLKDEPTIRYACETTGNMELSALEAKKIRVDFNNCNNEPQGAVYQGSLVLNAWDFYTNPADEVLITATVSIEESLKVGDRSYGEISGDYQFAVQRSLYGELVKVSQRSGQTLQFGEPGAGLILRSLNARVDYDSDLWNGSIGKYYVQFAGSYLSDQLKGGFDCESEVFTNNSVGFYPDTGAIYCSGKQSLSLRVQPSDYNVFMGLRDGSGSDYDEFLGVGWFDFLPVFEYQSGGFSADFPVAPLLGRVIYQSINDAVYSFANDKIYASIQSGSALYANHIVEIDPVTELVTDSVLLKGEAGPLGISADGLVLYAGFTAINEVQQLDLATLAPVQVLSLGETDDYRMDPLYAENIEVSPMDNTEVAVSTYYLGSTDYHYPDEAKLFRNGIDANTLPNYFSGDITSIVFSGDGKTLFASNDSSTDDSLYQYNVVPAGLEYVGKKDNYTYGEGDLLTDGNTLYTPYGRVVDMAAGLLKGKYSSLLESNIYDENALLLTPDGQYAYSYDVYVEVYDKDSFQSLGYFDPEMPGDFLRFFNVGSNDFAIATDEGIKLFKHSDVVIDNGWSCFKNDIVDNRTTVAIDSIICLFNDAVLDERRNKIYASISGVMGEKGNSIAVLDSNTLQVEQYIPVGPEPYELELSLDGELLYVGFKSTNQYFVITVDDMEVRDRVDLGFESLGGPLFAGDIEPFPADPESIALSLARQGFTTDFNSVAVFTAGVKAATEINGSTALGVDATRLKFIDIDRLLGYNADNTRHQLFDFFADQSGITLIDEYKDLLWGFTTELDYQEGRLFSSRGYIVDTESMKRTAILDGLFTDNFTRHQIAIDTRRRLIYVYAAMLTAELDPVIKVFNMDNFEEVASVPMPTFTVFLAEPRALLNLDEDRLLVVLSNQMYVIDKDHLEDI